MSPLVTYVRRDRRRTRCPECGRHYTLTLDGRKRFCAYAEDHARGMPIFERAASPSPETSER